MARPFVPLQHILLCVMHLTLSGEVDLQLLLRILTSERASLVLTLYPLTLVLLSPRIRSLALRRTMCIETEAGLFREARKRP